MDRTEIDERVREVIAHHGRLDLGAVELRPDLDLWSAGMTSLASVEVMLGLESEFDLEFPDRMMRREIFSSIATICDAIDELVESP